jgi:hypothetical protein
MQPVSGEGSVWDRAYEPRNSPRRGKESSGYTLRPTSENLRRLINLDEVQLGWDAGLDINDKLFRFVSRAIGRV